MNFLKIAESKKPISCGIIIIDPIDDTILAAHPTHHTANKGDWDIPKGHLEDDEHAKEAAIRELYEETGMVLTPEDIADLQDLGKFEYSKYKDLRLFTLRKCHPPLYTLKCRSMFLEKDNKEYPEMDDYKKVALDDLSWLFPNLQRVIKKALSLI